jgi:hypothetical protein
MAGVTAIQGVDDTLKKLVAEAVAPLTPLADVTVGPLDRDDEGLRLNWFLYEIGPHPAYRNMEPPRRAWRAARGRPPLALRLRYMLTAFPASSTKGGDQEQFAHASLAAAMQALHSSAVISEGNPALSPLAEPLVEPLRVTLDALNLDGLAKIWTAVTEPLRLSVGYEVSLVVVDGAERHEAGPPVRERRVLPIPSPGPRLLAVRQPRVSDGVDIEVAVEGLAGEATFTLAREDGDPAGPAAWPMTVVGDPPPGTVLLRLPRPDLMPGARRLEVSTEAPAAEGIEGRGPEPEGGAAGPLPAGRDAIGITVVPVVRGPASAARGAAVELDCAHAAADVEVFLGGAKLDPADVSFDSPTAVTVTIPAAAAPGPTTVALRANRVAGPASTIEVQP